MASSAIVHLIGTLGRDPETRYSANAKMSVTFSMAVSRKRGDAEITNWYRPTVFGSYAETLDRLATQGDLIKGRQVYVVGRLEPREYQDQQGQTRTSLDVVATEVQLLGPRATAGPPNVVADDDSQPPF